MKFSFAFVPAGTVAASETGKVYVDVGNAFCPGILDHHHPDAPDACTAELVLSHPEYILSQSVDDHLTIIPHEYPDLDAITGAFFVRMHANGDPIEKVHHQWAEYVCRIDQGFTTLDVEQPVTPYSLFMMRMQLLGKRGTADSTSMLQAGFEFIESIFEWMKSGGNLNNPVTLKESRMFSDEVSAIADDLGRYKQDLERAEKMECYLPKKDGTCFQKVAGLWIARPESAMFKSWTRGDKESADNDQGFIFLGIQVSDHRFILSVNPSSNVYLKGLGALLEKAETEKREKLGKVRKGENRPGYDSPDPWYDGRSPLHNYTIIDSPRGGTVLQMMKVKNIVRNYIKNS